jgi:hypothetical protein
MLCSTETFILYLNDPARIIQQQTPSPVAGLLHNVLLHITIRINLNEGEGKGRLMVKGRLRLRVRGRVVEGRKPGDTSVRDASSKGRIIQRTHCPRYRTFKTFRSGTQRSGTTRLGTLHIIYTYIHGLINYLNQIKMSSSKKINL